MNASNDFSKPGKTSVRLGGTQTEALAVDDRRSFERQAKSVQAKLIGSGCRTIDTCRVRDISAGGVFVQIPGGNQVTVGQRYDVVLLDAAVQEDGWGATVIRTEQSPGADDAVGAAMRFDQPVYL